MFQIIHCLICSLRDLIGDILLQCILEKLKYQNKALEVWAIGISNDKWEEIWNLINRETQNEIGSDGTKGSWCQSSMVY